jgi:hypothetical protein
VTDDSPTPRDGDGRARAARVVRSLAQHTVTLLASRTVAAACALDMLNQKGHRGDPPWSPGPVSDRLRADHERTACTNGPGHWIRYLRALRGCFGPLAGAVVAPGGRSAARPSRRRVIRAGLFSARGMHTLRLVSVTSRAWK